MVFLRIARCYRSKSIPCLLLLIDCVLLFLVQSISRSETRMLFCLACSLVVLRDVDVGKQHLCSLASMSIQNALSGDGADYSCATRAPQATSLDIEGGCLRRAACVHQIKTMFLEGALRANQDRKCIFTAIKESRWMHLLRRTRGQCTVNSV
jgi:hypothetical protein